MPLGMEVVTGFVTAPSTTFTAWTLAAGNTLTIRAGTPGRPIVLLSAWADQQTAGNLRIRSPQMHDASEGMRLFAVASEVDPLIPFRPNQRFIPQDVLTVQQTGSATAGDIETGALLIWYADLPGISAKLIGAGECTQRSRHIMAVENTLALGTAGGYSGEEAATAEFDFGKANTDYALIGYGVSAECAVVRWRGVDTGNLGVGGPGNETNHELTRRWFFDMSQMTGLPTIPVFNFANRAGILIDGAQDENGTDVTVTSLFMELGPPLAATAPRAA